jgi:class 3 adenylate cyclase
MTEAEMLEAQADVGSRIAPLTEQATLAIYHGQQEHAWSKAFVEYVEGACDKAGVLRRVHRPPAVCFLDVTGYTRLTEERGDHAAADLAARLASVVRRSAHQHGGQPVKWLGDGVMFYFRKPGQCVLAALEMVEAVATRAPSARPRGDPRRAGRLPGRGLLRPDGEHRGEDRRLRETRGGARESGCRRRGRRNAGHVHGHRARRVERRVGLPSSSHGSSDLLVVGGAPDRATLTRSLRGSGRSSEPKGSRVISRPEGRTSR